MPGAATCRAYYGDFRLWREGIDYLERPARAAVQEFEGVDQDLALVIPSSVNARLEVLVRTLGYPNPVQKDRAGFRAILRAVRAGLQARADRLDPLVWIEDDTTLRVLAAASPSLQTTAPHGYSTGDRLLIRRAGVGLWTLLAATVTGADTFTGSAVTGTQLHAIAAGDEVLRVDAYWVGMVAQPFPQPVEPRDEGDFWNPRVEYIFKGSGEHTYSRAVATVGS